MGNIFQSIARCTEIYLQTENLVNVNIRVH